MIVVNIFEAKAKLSEYLEVVARGERVLICKRNVPVAELRPIEQGRTGPRPIGLDKERLRIPASFFEPLPDELLEAFDVAGPRVTDGRVAEAAAPPYGAPRTRKRRARR